MAENELNEELLISPLKKVRVLSEDALSIKEPSVFEKLAEQRQYQRKTLFTFAITSSAVSLIILLILIVLQAVARLVKGPAFSLLAGYEFEVLSVSIFGQLVGIVAIIAKALWDETPFKDLLLEQYKGHITQDKNGH